MDNNNETNIVEEFVVEDSAPNRSETDTEQELLLKIEELDDAWNDLTIKRRNLYNQKNSMEQQATTLNREKIKQQTALRKLKSTKAFSVFILYFVAVILAYAIYSFEDINYDSNRSMLTANHNEQIKALDISRDDMIRQIKNLQQDSLKEELASQGKPSNINNTILTEENRKELDTYIASLNRYPTQRIQQKKLDGVSYYEVVQMYDLGKYMLCDSGNFTVYPGAIIRGDSLMQGSANYSLVSQKQAPITLVCSRGGSVRLDDISYGTVKEAVEQLWNASNSDYSDKWEYSLHSFKNEENLKMSLGIGAASNSLSFGVSQTESKSTIAITFTETYFSVGIEPLSNATQYFQYGCDLEKLGNYEPAYVSSVDYGRMKVVLITTELSESELNAKLAANIQGVDIDADIGYIKTNIASSYQVYNYGGDSTNSLQLIDSSNENKSSGGLKGWWDELLNGKSKTSAVNDINETIVSDDSLTNPVPLAYHLNYISDNSSVPAIAIINDDIVLKETARLVTLTLDGDKPVPGIFRLSDSANAIGYVVNTNQIQINKKGETSGEIQFIWDSSNPNSLTGFFNDSSFSCSMSEIPEETDYVYELECESGWFSQKSTKIHIYISGAVYETP